MAAAAAEFEQQFRAPKDKMPGSQNFIPYTLSSKSVRRIVAIDLSGTCIDEDNIKTLLHLAIPFLNP